MLVVSFIIPHVADKLIGQALPSCISILTKSSHESRDVTASVSSQSQDSRVGLTRQQSAEDTVLQRLLKYSKVPRNITAPQKTRDVFNDLQRILGSDHMAWQLTEGCHFHSCPWNTEAENDITRLRNLMNSSQRLIIEREPASILTGNQGAHNQTLCFPNWSRGTAATRQMLRHSSWNTSYGRIFASFRTHTVDSDVQAVDADVAAMDQAFSARIAIAPKITGRSSSYIVFDFASNVASIDLSMKLTYFPMVPNDSKVFTIVRDGEVHQLVEAFEEGYASLNDRDEQGRSLLKVSCDHASGSRNT